MLKKCFSLCLEVHCYNDWWLQNCWLQHLERFMFSFKCLWTKGQKKVFYDLMHSRLRSVTRWPQTLTQVNLHNAGDRTAQKGNPTCQGASQPSEAGGLCQWHHHQNIQGNAVSAQTSVIVLGSSGAHSVAHRSWLQYGCGHPSAFPAVPGGVDPNSGWILREQSGRSQSCLQRPQSIVVCHKDKCTLWNASDAI